MPPSVVVITNDSFQGQLLIDTINRRGIVLDAILMQTGGFALPRRRGWGPARRVVGWPRSVASSLRRKLRYWRRRRRAYVQRCRRIVSTGDMNSARMVRDLRRLAPDFVLWGGGGILQPRTIETARVGVLNTHPALLPWVRGCGVVGGSLEAGVAVGATVHYIDARIDTGPVVERRLLPVPEGSTTLAALEEGAYRLAADMMADVVEGIVRRGEIPTGAPQPARFPLFRWPDEQGTRAQDALAREGRAHELFRAWSPLCADRERWVLPREHFTAAPSLALQPLE